MIFYTADLHFGYEAIIEQTGRPFFSAEEMDKTLVDNWNNLVSEDDTVYFIGDIGGHCTPFPAQQLEKLRGQKHLIRGNHDMCLEDQNLLFEYFESVSDFLEIDDGEYHITLCHYPIVYVQGGYMIHGHLHNTKLEAFEALKNLPRVMNAGVDINDFRPVTLEQLIENNRSFYNDPQRGNWSKKHGHSNKKHKWKAVYKPLPIKNK